MPTVVKEVLTPAKTEPYVRQILSKIREVREGLSARRAAEFVYRPDEPLDSGDWCQKSHDEWLYLNQNRIELALLRELEAAMRRHGEGALGICQGCGEPISEKRLDAVPWAKFCIPCEERAGHPGDE
jgi:DnaK suppressor protein